MTFSRRTFRNFRYFPGVWIALAVALAAGAGCSTAQSPAGSGTNMNHVLPSGQSVAGWLVVPSGGTHANTATQDFIANGGSSDCGQCHGSDLAGGISKTSCYGNAAGCHHGPVANWSDPSVHGATAKKAPGNSSFFSCQICHGSNFAGRLTAPACSDCHGVSAPHPPKPWRGAPLTHVDTNPANAPVCAGCHFPGSPNNPAGHPPTPAPPGTAPGCFNSTLCHGAAGAPHPVGSAWVTTPPAAQPHGNDAKAAPSSTGGFAFCQVCHGTGTNFAGGSSGISCYPCHGSSSPHPSQWRTGNTYVHTTTDTGNASVCAFCHTAGNNSPIAPPSPPAPAGTPPGCFNSTLCHGASAVPHPVGGLWFAFPPEPQVHGNAAKATPSATTGFAYCQVCHGTGTDFAGGSSGVSCYTTCHLVNSPHPAQWRTGDTYVHTSTAAGNATVCAYCHTAGNNSPIAPPSPPAPGGTPPGCFNSTLCHGASAAAHPVPFNDTAHYSVTSATFPGSCSTCHDVSAPSTKAGPVCQSCHAAASPLTAANCTSCHASPPNGGTGAAYANIAGAHAVHIALNNAGNPVTCDTCHNGLGPSLANLNHYDRAKSRVTPGDVIFNSSYQAQTGTRSFDNVSTSVTYLTCNAVSCHGGQRTPNWQSGTLNVNAQCTNCHPDGTTTTQYNGPTSANHNRSQHVAAACTACHNTTTLAVNHFTNLSTPALEGPASATIGGTGTAITAWDPVNKSCDPSCHGPQTW